MWQHLIFKVFSAAKPWWWVALFGIDFLSRFLMIMINQVRMSETGNNPNPRLDFCYQLEPLTADLDWPLIMLFHFYSVHTTVLQQRVWRCKIPGGPLKMIFSRGFYYKVYFSSRGNLHNYKLAARYLGCGTEIFFPVYIIFFPRPKGSNQLSFISRGFMSQTIILSRLYWFLKICSSIPPYG